MSTSIAETTRLCIVTPIHSSDVAGGAEYQIECFISALKSLQRYDIFYLSALVPDRPAAEHYKIVRIGHKRHAPRFGYVCQAVPLYRALRSIRPQAIYQRVACGYTGVCAYYAQRYHARLIWHVAHDSDVTPGMSLDGRNPVRRFLEKRSVEYGIRRANCIVTQTADQAKLLERNYHRPADAVIPNFHPSPCEKVDKSGERIVAWVASIKPWKRPEVFVDLADALSDQPDIRFVMVGADATGSGDRSWAQGLLRRIRDTRNLLYLGGCTQAEVNGLLARSHVFVNTSRHEGFPNTFIQAWMRKVPVVSLHVNPDQLLEREVIGIFCDGSEIRLREAVRTLMMDSALRGRYAAKAHAYAVSRHSMANANGLIELIEARTE